MTILIKTIKKDNTGATVSETEATNSDIEQARTVSKCFIHNDGDTTENTDKDGNITIKTVSKVEIIKDSTGKIIGVNTIWS